MFTKGTVPEDIQCHTNDTQACPNPAMPCCYVSKDVSMFAGLG